MEVMQFQGSRTVDTPHEPGIYAWYYRPPAFSKREVETLGKLITAPYNVKTEVAMRYNILWETDSNVNVLHGGKQKRKPVKQAVSDLLEKEDDLIISFFRSGMIPYFTKPIYIGQTENLFKRVYKEHYLPLMELWEPDGGITKYLEENSDADVEDVLDRFDEDHSFAINARVKGIAPKDLVVCVCQVELQGNLRHLEKILQILTDPICGRE